jgi:hypothetical protein
MSRTKDQASRIALASIAAVAVLLCIFVFAACGTTTTPGSSSVSGSPSTSAPAETISSPKKDVADWYATVGPDVDTFIADLEAGDYSHAGLTQMIADVHALQVDPPFPASAPFSVQQSWSNALDDFKTGLVAAQNGDQETGASKLMDGTSELSAVTDYVNSLNT